ncbi:MAG: hypothetical protein IJF02_05040 [Oscillospiraceae bacterium]|nr:hypothetical protein [Oscillospiraceae bacterium]
MANDNPFCMNAQEAIAKAEQELSTSFYIADISRSPGMKAIHSNRCRWLSVIVGLAKKIANGKAVEVVRCKDCKHYVAPQGTYVCDCFEGLNFATDNDFCSYGERRKGK